jgi:hypothetical protein
VLCIDGYICRRMHVLGIRNLFIITHLLPDLCSVSVVYIYRRMLVLCNSKLVFIITLLLLTCVLHRGFHLSSGACLWNFKAFYNNTSAFWLVCCVGGLHLSPDAWLGYLIFFVIPLLLLTCVMYWRLHLSSNACLGNSKSFYNNTSASRLVFCIGSLHLSSDACLV